MLSRRDILLGAAAGASLTAIGGMRAMALTSEPMAPEDLKAFALGCSGVASHQQLIADAKWLLNDEIKRGMKTAVDTETVVCPLCHCSIQVTSDISF
jgi:hypothetical protein